MLLQNADEARPAQAKADLAHMYAAIAIFASDDGKTVRPYVEIHQLFKRGGMATISWTALQSGQRNTREQAQA